MNGKPWRRPRKTVKYFATEWNLINWYAPSATLNFTIIPRARVGFEMVDSQQGV